MDKIINFAGKVKFPITIDPSVWIFDDRKQELESFFEATNETNNELETYTKAISKHWSREIQEGATYPPTLKTEKKYEKERLLTSTFAIVLKPFIENAAPFEEAKTFIIETETNEYAFPLEDAYSFILCFSSKGKPLQDDGPVHVYFQDGSNKSNPITHVKTLRIE
ncbi:peptidyl-prolyl cis-trans isomerase [Bacillus spongiae]|uniref:Peptidyl-prolyl cis-trans isomerase n=1 Tax=Bacillus spongiae TaxID=2683610 RepID=A0ABU8H9Y4_9BACI